MATKASLLGQPLAAWADSEFARRVALARQPAAAQIQPPRKRHLLGETIYLIEPLLRPFRRLKVKPASQPRIVMILPGFATHPSRMRYLARQLERAGHKTKRWGLGFNLGPTENNIDVLERRLEEIHARYGQPVVMLGWSLGGLFARELAHRRPELVAKVITMGSPFSGDPRANNAWRLYQFVTGHAVDNPPVDRPVAMKPPVETVALWSPRDGIVAPRSARGKPGERDRAIALRCRHMGFSYTDEAILTVLAELERPAN
ncbi:alpha/beta hydrolase [Altererythrobacter sp. BO-6]|uniref:esterase/lipase family protein n=1 Tax=Altererythrobacter sp. BO-6 TaxID=2604537 RepID=UPI0013E13161|nr:alpha/beta fold hydrolase [Altererythrobacter sp. BO-6]QIG54968.1 alpha/beta hydrolase [Altererythrobacter sp. BO-6]